MQKAVVTCAAMAAILTAGAWISPAAAQDTETVDIKEWEVPWENSRPRDPYAESATSIWFVGQRSHYLGHLNAETGELTKVDLPDEAGPHNVIVAEDGTVWYSGNLLGYIGRYDPETEEITRIETPDVKDPHTLILDEQQEHIYFTVQFDNHVGRLTLDNQEVELTEVEREGARPYGIDIAPDGTPWVVLFGTNQLARINDDMSLTYVDLPREEARPRRIGITDDGRIWYVDFAEGYLGAYDPESEAFDEWAMPSGGQARPYGMAVDGQNRIWFVETGVSPNRFVGFAPEAEEFFSVTPIPSGARAVRHMDYHPGSGAIWFGTDANTIGRAVVE